MDEQLASFREHLRRTLGRVAAEFIDLRLRGKTTSEIRWRTKFARLGHWRLRMLLKAIRAEARFHARRIGDERFVAAVEVVLRRKQKPASRQPALPNR